MIMVTRPACGIAAAPTLAAVAITLQQTMADDENLITADHQPPLYLIIISWISDNSMPRTCDMNIGATASYNAVPSMLIAAPSGSINRATIGWIPLFFSRH